MIISADIKLKVQDRLDLEIDIADLKTKFETWINGHLDMLPHANDIAINKKDRFIHLKLDNALTNKEYEEFII